MSLQLPATNCTNNFFLYFTGFILTPCDNTMAEGTDSSRKRPASVELQLCIICQNDNQRKLMTVSTDSLQSVENIRQVRTKLSHDNFRDATDRLTEIFQADDPSSFCWHKDCRSSYMSKQKIERLRSKEINEPTTSTSMQQSQPKKNILRSKTPQINWKLCIFCQQEKKESLHLVQELRVGKRILEASKYDQVLSVRLACVNDLTAADGAYHRSCMVKFERQTAHIASMAPNTSDIAMAWLCRELKQSAEQTDILDLVDVWERYCNIASDANVEIPPSFISRRGTFKEKLAKCLEGLYEVVVLHDHA